MRVGGKVRLRDGGSSGHDGVRVEVEGSEMQVFLLVFHQPDKCIFLIAPSPAYKVGEAWTKSNVYKCLDARRFITIRRAGWVIAA